jgi:hypothetical protein
MLGIEVDNWNDNYDSSESPSDYFSSLESALSSLAVAFDDDIEALAKIQSGLDAINEAIAQRDSEVRESRDDSEYYHRAGSGPYGHDSRSIFDDVDD